MKDRGLTILKQLGELMEEKFGEAEGRRVTALAQQQYAALCAKWDATDPQPLHQHTHNNIFPVLACYDVITGEGLMERAEAVDFLYESFGRCMEPAARMLKKLLKIPGVYKVGPAVMRRMVSGIFGPKAGFAADYYPAEKGRVRFNMTRCPYYEVCARHGVPELTACFCHSDDVVYGNMHPKLIWGRTKTIGTGGDCCDFDLRVEK